MRILRHLIIFIVLISAAFILRSSLPPQPSLTESNPGPQVQGEMSKADRYFDIETDTKVIRLRWFKVDNLSEVELIANYEQLKSSADTKDEFKCQQLVNGGFYDVDYKPLGLVISKGEEVYGYRKNVLMNGILSINDYGTPRITRNSPSGNLVNAIQSGPLLWENGSPLLLNLKADKDARRVLAATTANNELYFFIVYDLQSSFKGVLLADLPKLIEQVEDKLGIQIADALNLDGGSASVFVDGDVALSELSPVGSFWCIK